MLGKKLRNFTFYLHRYLGLAVGLITIIIGITGSLLVFRSEISDFQSQQQFGQLTPLGNPLPIETLVDITQAAYANQPEAKVQRVFLPTSPTAPATVVYQTPKNDWIETYVNPYTGAILGDSLNANAMQQFFQIVYQLHYSLLVGDIGYWIAGIAGLLMCLLCISGIILWPGWRKLVAGFKIKWQAHPKRVNFDIHKVVGILFAGLLFLPFFTGFCWNLSDIARPVLYAATLSSLPPEEPTSTPDAGRSPLKLSAALLQQADAALPGYETTYVAIPKSPTEPFIIRKKSYAQRPDWDSSIFIDQYSGKILRVDNIRASSPGERLESTFTPLHFGTFGGLSTRILYVFVGLAPLILFITGFIMWWHRRRIKGDRVQSS